MNRKSFSTFSEASAYAKEQARMMGASVTIERHGSEWIVTRPCGDKSSSAGSLAQPRSIPSRSSAASEHMQRTTDVYQSQEKRKKKGEDIKELNAAFIEQLKEHYKSFSEQELFQTWEARETLEIEGDELEALKAVVQQVFRTRSGESLVKPELCPSCGQIGINCTCGRSWF